MPVSRRSEQNQLKGALYDTGDKTRQKPFYKSAIQTRRKIMDSDNSPHLGIFTGLFTFLPGKRDYDGFYAPVLYPDSPDGISLQEKRHTPFRSPWFAVCVNGRLLPVA